MISDEDIPQMGIPLGIFGETVGTVSRAISSSKFNVPNTASEDIHIQADKIMNAKSTIENKNSQIKASFYDKVVEKGDLNDTTLSQAITSANETKRNLNSFQRVSAVNTETGNKEPTVRVIDDAEETVEEKQIEKFYVKTRHFTKAFDEFTSIWDQITFDTLDVMNHTYLKKLEAVKMYLRDVRP